MRCEYIKPNGMRCRQSGKKQQNGGPITFYREFEEFRCGYHRPGSSLLEGKKQAKRKARTAPYKVPERRRAVTLETSKEVQGTTAAVNNEEKCSVAYPASVLTCCADGEEPLMVMNCEYAHAEVEGLEDKAYMYTRDDAVACCRHILEANCGDGCSGQYTENNFVFKTNPLSIDVDPLVWKRLSASTQEEIRKLSCRRCCRPVKTINANTVLPRD